MAKRSTNHVSMINNGFGCFHCGAKELPLDDGHPIPITELVARMRSFDNAHRKCKETENSPTRRLEASEMEWENGLYVGSSSGTIFAVMMGRPPKGMDPGSIGAIPQDPDDFSRCHRLLLVKPEWRLRLQEVAARFKAWAPLVRNWDSLTEQFEAKNSGLYARMQKLVGGVDE